nr:MAG TPA: hypothetical protein [Caudoviricetes sp.]
MASQKVASLMKGEAYTPAILLTYIVGDCRSI